MVARYDNKIDPDKDKLFMCNSFNTRNRYKRKEYQIPEDQPQCPIYKDNRCCGGCKLARTCDHCVDCNCFGYTYSTIGGIKNGICLVTFYSRLKKGWSYEEAATKPLLRKVI